MSTGANISATTVLSPTTPGALAVFVAAWGPTCPPHAGTEANQMALWGNILPQGNNGVWFPMNQWAIDPDWAVFLGAPPTVVSWGPGRVDYFVAGEDGSLWHIWLDHALTPAAKWGVWETFRTPAAGVTIASPIAVVAPSPNNLAVYAAGSDGNLWSLKFTPAGWGPWQSHPLTAGLQIVSGPAAAGHSMADLHVFVQATNQELWWLQPNGVWYSKGAPSPQVGVNNGTGIAATSFGPAQVAIFVQGTDGGLWTNVYLPAVQAGHWANGKWTLPANPGPSSWRGWTSRGHGIDGTPSCVSGGPNTLDVFAINGDPNIQASMVHTYLNVGLDQYGEVYNLHWGGAFDSLGPGLTGSNGLRSPLCPVAWGGATLEVLSVNGQGMVQRMSYLSGHWLNWATIPGPAIPVNG